MLQLSLPRFASFFAIAFAIVCGSQSAHAGVITQSNWEDTALLASVDLPTDTPQRSTLRQAEQGGMEGVPVSSAGGSQAVGLLSSLIRLMDASITGRTLIVDLSLPDDPFLDGLPKPA